MKLGFDLWKAHVYTMMELSRYVRYLKMPVFHRLPGAPWV